MPQQRNAARRLNDRHSIGTSPLSASSTGYAESPAPPKAERQRRTEEENARLRQELETLRKPPSVIITLRP
ncbi:MAG: hypothetical protein U0694_15460 [Anaerolineae bacterium]